MCGIAGILRTWQPGQAPPAHAEAIPEAWLDILDESIKHRGPDGRGRFRQRVTRPDGTVVDVALVHRRLSIIDHADGAQPMVIGGTALGGTAPGGTAQRAVSQVPHRAQRPAAVNQPLISREGRPYTPLRAHACPKCGDGVVAVAFNGCIYNHRELRRELEAAGHVFHTDHSDTEVLLHGWREWGDALAEHLEAMFALGLFDSSSGKVVIGRDYAGEKPLYATKRESGRAYIFSSSAAGILRLGDALRLDRTPLGAGYIDGSNHIEHHLPIWIGRGFDWEMPVPDFEEICPSTAWSALPIEQVWGGVPWRSNWAPRATEPLADLDEVERLLDGATHSRLEADVPIGCLLSGGVDSSLLAAMARRHRPDIASFTVRMPAAAFDESQYAERVAQHLGLRYTTLDCDARPAEDLLKLIHQLGVPFGDSSLLPTHWLCRAVRQTATVAISGDGGDELFCGYERHTVQHRFGRWAWLLGLIPPGVFPRRDPKSPLTKASRLVEWCRRSLSIDIFDDHDDAALRGVKSPRRRGGLAQAVDQPRSDFGYYLPCDILRKTDSASMASALEVRSPFLSSGSIAFGLASPLAALMPHGQRKGLLRALARRYLPAEIVDRPKMGFAVPIGEWFRTDYGGMRQLLYDHLEAADPFPGLAEAGVELNRAFIARMLREHDAAGERSLNPWHGRDHSQRLYMLLVLSIWCRWLKGL